jgi:hypothetical protein
MHLGKEETLINIAATLKRRIQKLNYTEGGGKRWYQDEDHPLKRGGGM